MLRTTPDNPWQLDRPSRLIQRAFRELNRFPFIPSGSTYNLTISHQQKFLWFRVAKVGTRTLLGHLKDNGVQLDVEHASFVFYPRTFYADYFKFAFVRNPWDRLVSCWNDKILNYSGRGQIPFGLDESSLDRMRDFRRFVGFVASLDLETCDRHLRLQSRLIDLANLDYLGRMETFSIDFANVCQALNMEGAEPAAKNASPNRQPYQTYYDDALRDQVLGMYRKDIQLFGYTF